MIVLGEIGTVLVTQTASVVTQFNHILKHTKLSRIILASFLTE